MAEVDTCLDAFKHLPYFKPLYTTILRQQMQYLTEQLSCHAGEESLVLTTNLASGTISSLTSTYGTGFLDLRADIKKQFTVHCAKNKMKHERSYNRRNISLDNVFINDQSNSSHKRKKPDDHNKQHAITDNTALGKPKESVTESVTDLDVGIEDVRSLQSNEDQTDETKVEKATDNVVGVSNLTDSNCSNTVVIKKEPDVGEVFAVALEPNQSKVGDYCKENVIVVKDAVLTVEQRNPEQTKPIDSSHDVTDDMATVRNSYLDNAGSNSELGKVVTESDGSEMWIIAGNTNRIDFKELPDNKSNENCSDTSLSKSVGSVSSQTYQNTVHIVTAYANVPSTAEKWGQCQLDITDHNMTGNLAFEKRTKFKCSYCSQSFTTYASRKRHERKHTGETPWACEHCDKKFYRKDDLNVHSLKHRGQKPYTCQYCLSGYSKRKMLEEHVLTQHGGTRTLSNLKYE